jgi:hypothetical protein
MKWGGLTVRQSLTAMCVAKPRVINIDACGTEDMEEFEIPKPPRSNYLNAEHGLKSWLLTKDHKRIGMLYRAISFFFFIGSLYAMAIES